MYLKTEVLGHAFVCTCMLVRECVHVFYKIFFLKTFDYVSLHLENIKLIGCSIKKHFKITSANYDYKCYYSLQYSEHVPVLSLIPNLF